LLRRRQVVAQRQHVLHHPPLQRSIGSDYGFDLIPDRGVSAIAIFK
jgi:hypothetical protein